MTEAAICSLPTVTARASARRGVLPGGAASRTPAPLENITSRGKPAEFAHHSAFGYYGGGPIELMEIVRLVQLGEIDITFHDASASLGHDIEIHVDSQGLRDFFQMVREGAEGWDGSEPLRPAAT